ncbi:MAG: hypothetical protein MUC65_03265 [Pontiellaceae bacterium]|jgi:hypothetical protein|nr:hypothetical protein [Pontiellaceae bacterium]
MKHVKLQTVSLKNHAILNERWLQDVVASDPSILGIGDVVLKDRERIHPRAGRLDLLLQDADGHGRYEVEIQLGATDESHVIRTIEYWDIERRKYPQYDHTAVIVAEDITSPQKNAIRLEISLPQMEEFDEIIETAELDMLDYDKRFGNYRIRLTGTELDSKKDTLIKLMQQARDNRK